MSVEKEILKHLITDAKSFKAIQDKNLKSSIFVEEEDSEFNRQRVLFELAVDYYRNYGSVLTRDGLSKLVTVSKVKPEVAATLIMAYDEVSLVTTTSPIEFLIDTAKQTFKKYKVKASLMKASELYRANDVDSIIPYMQGEFYSVNYDTDALSSETTVMDSADYRLEAYSAAKKAPGVQVGFPALDKATNGLYPGQIFIIAAATSEGKSVMLLNMAHNAWKYHGKNVLYITIENYRDDLLRRFDSLDARVSYNHLKNGDLTDDEKLRVAESLADQKTRHNVFHVVDRPAECTPEFIEAKINDLQPTKFDILFVDYLHIMSLSTKAKVERDQYFGNLAAELRRIGRIKKIPVVTAVQVNREGINEKSNTYGVQHIAMSQFISNHADIVMSLRAIDPAQALASGIVDIEASLVKHRDGPKARFSIKANFERMTMQEHELQCEVIPTPDAQPIEAPTTLPM